LGGGAGDERKAFAPGWGESPLVLRYLKYSS
jgi:hypothetical protein